MNQKLYQAAQVVVERARLRGKTGITTDAQELADLNRDAGGIIPDWYIELVTTFPLCRLSFSHLAYEPEGEYDGLVHLSWSDVADMRWEMLEGYPGIAVRARGYFPVAGDEIGSGDPFFLPNDEGDDPPLYQIAHDLGDDPDNILAEGRYLIAPSLSDFFEMSILE